MNYRSLSKILYVFLVILMLCLAGCQSASEEDRAKGSEENKRKNEREGENNKITGAESAKSSQERRQRIEKDSRKIAESCAHIIRRTKAEKKPDTFKLQQEIIDFLGEAGYVVVDIDNQIDMANWEKAEKFCQVAESKKEAKIAIFLVMDNGGFIRYDLETEDGRINVLTSSVFPEKESVYFEEYTAYSWKYTKKGYLFLEQYHMSGFDGAPGQTAIRIKPLDKECRRLNRTYVLPLGYRGHKLLISDWDGKDYAELDFYDLYEVMYLMQYKKDLPYPDEYTKVEYEVPENEFEGAIKTYLDIDSTVIRKQAVYHEDTKTYRYRPRGLYDSQEPYEPFPEVTAYEKQKDGCVKLTVEAVWAMKMEDCAVISELTVRPLENGHFQYVSNHVVSVSGSLERLWYTPRLIDKEWNVTAYGSGMRTSCAFRENRFTEEPSGAVDTEEINCILCSNSLYLNGTVSEVISFGT